MKPRGAEGEVVALLRPTRHAHAWRLAEVEYLECGVVRRMECTCGEVDYASAC